MDCSGLRTEPGLADLYNRWSVWMECTVRSSGESGVQWDSLFVSPVVWSALILSTIFTFFMCFVSFAFWKSLILMACWVDAAGIRLQNPRDPCVCVRESVWHVSVASWPCFLRGIVGMCSLVATAATVHLFVSSGSNQITWTPHGLHIEKDSVFTVWCSSLNCGCK